MRTMMNNWIKFSIAFVAAISLASSSFAQDQSDEPAKEESPRQKLVTKKRLNTIAKTQSPVEGFFNGLICFKRWITARLK